MKKKEEAKEKAQFHDCFNTRAKSELYASERFKLCTKTFALKNHAF